MTTPQYTFAEVDKRKFAAELLKRPNDPLAAAISVFGDTNAVLGKCSFVASFWPNDPSVVKETIGLLSSANIKEFIASKEEAARAVWEWTKSANIQFDDRIKAMKLFCEIQDYIAKPGTSVNVTVPINKVMLVKASANDEDWERELEAQQALSMSESVAVH